MKWVILVLAILTLLVPAASARAAPDNALGIDPARLEEMRGIMASIDSSWADHVGRALEMLSITHRFRVGDVVSGPVPLELEPRGRSLYPRHLDCGPSTSGTKGSRDRPHKQTFSFRFENLVLELLKQATERDVSREVLAAAMMGGDEFDEIVRFTYDFVVSFDNDTEDELSYRIVIPMDVTVHCTSCIKARAGDGCEVRQDDYRLLEASYGPLLFTTEKSDSH